MQGSFLEMHRSLELTVGVLGGSVHLEPGNWGQRWQFASPQVYLATHRS